MGFSTGAQTFANVSAISYLHKREILKGLVDVNNEEGFMDILGLAGAYEEVKQPNFHHFVESRNSQLITVGGTIVGSGSATTLTGVTAPTGYVRKGLKVKHPNGGVSQVTALSTAGGTDTFSLTSVNGSNLTLVSGNKLSPVHVMVGEKSDAPASLKQDMTKIYNLIEYSRETHESTDTEIAADVEIEIDGKNYIWNRDIANAFMRFKGGLNANLIVSKISAKAFEDTSSPLVDPINGGNQQSQRGFDEYITTYGINDTIATPGTLVLADLEDFFNLITAARGPQNYTGYCSNAVGMKYSIFLKGLNSSGVTSGRLSLDGKEIDYNADKLTFGKYSLQIVGLPIFDHDVVASQTDIVKSMYWVADGKVNTSAGMKPRLSMRYVKTIQPGFGNDIWEEWDTGSLARGGATGSVRSRQTHWFTAQALQFLGSEHCGKQIVLA
jgi:hypothetical protein